MSLPGSIRGKSLEVRIDVRVERGYFSGQMWDKVSVVERKGSEYIQGMKLGHGEGPGGGGAGRKRLESWLLGRQAGYCG